MKLVKQKRLASMCSHSEETFRLPTWSDFVNRYSIDNWNNLSAFKTKIQVKNQPGYEGEYEFLKQSIQFWDKTSSLIIVHKYLLHTSQGHKDKE